MNLFRSLRNIFLNRQNLHPGDGFVFPYSEDAELRRRQAWDNLQKGILLEDSLVLIPWASSYNGLERYAEQRRHRADRTEWFLGAHPILDGYPCRIQVMKWGHVGNTRPFGGIEEWLGFDQEGYQRFLELNNRLTQLLGPPSLIDLKEFGPFQLGSIEWTDRNALVRLVGIEQFACKYWLHVQAIDPYLR